jgi:hypothetical protein
MIVLGCSPNSEKIDIIGTWNCVSVFDFETQEISRPPIGEKLIVEFKSDSLYLRSVIDNNTEYDEEIYAWLIKGDSIFFDDFYSGYIRELTTESLIVDVYIFDVKRFSLMRIK